MKISIAMATYNGGAFLREQLDSFNTQTRPPDELVISDDRSTDNTIAIARDFSKSAPFDVHIETNSSRLGITDNFSKAISLCTGDFVLLSDQDDVWLPNKIAALESVASSNPDISCFINDALLADVQLRLSGASKRSQIRANGMPEETMVMGCCTAFRRDLLEVLLPIPNDPQGFDGWLVHFADLLGRTKRLDLPLQLYRRHGNNASNIFVNRLSPLTRYDVFHNRIQKFSRTFSSLDGLNNEYQFYSLVAKRMKERMATIKRIIDEDSAERALGSAEARGNLLAQRKQIREQPIRRRLPMIWNLFQSGGYSSSGHTSGALKDLLVRRQRCSISLENAQS